MSLMRNRLLIRWTLPAALLVGCLLGPTVVQASSSLPKVTVAITPTSATVGGSLESGAVNVVVSDTGVKEGAVLLFQLKPGVTLAEVETFAASKKGSSDPNNSAVLGSIAFDVEVNPGKGTEAQTVLAPGLYVVLTSEGEKPVKVATHFAVIGPVEPAQDAQQRGLAGAVRPDQAYAVAGLQLKAEIREQRPLVTLVTTCLKKQSVAAL